MSSEDEAIIIMLSYLEHTHTHTELIPLWICLHSVPSHKHLIIGILKMHATCNNNAEILAHLNNMSTGTPWGPSYKDINYSRCYTISRTIRLKNTTNKTHLCCS